VEWVKVGKESGKEWGGWKAREWLGFRGVCARRVDLML